MPNHCSNTLRVFGDEDAIASIRKTLVDETREDEALTFKGLLPMPDELKGVKRGSISIGGERHRRWRETEDSGRVPVTKSETAHLRKTVGAADPLEWARRFWGTKWDAYWSDLSRDEAETLEFTFTTAWGPPEQFVQALRAEYPEAEVRCEYSEPNMDMQGVL